MKYSIIISLSIISLNLKAQLHIQQNATLLVQEEAILSIGGAVDNDGSFQNLGMVNFTGDWDNSAPTSVYNDGDIGTIEAIGPTGQVINNGDQQVSNLIINNGEEVFIDGNTFLVADELNLTNGIVRLGTNTSLIIGDNADIVGGSVDSFIEGTIIQRGNGERRYPLGLGTTYLPLTLLDVTGIDVEMAVGIGFFANGGVAPQPDLSGSVIGISDFHYWDVDVISGTFNGSLIQGTFEDADLVNFTNRNEFNFSNSTAAIVYAPNVGGDYVTLGNENIFDDDLVVNDGVASATFGTIVSSSPIDSVGFLAIGLVADVPEEGVVYIPTAFSPSALDPVDQTFKIFGQGIDLQDGFTVAVYNQYGVPVYETTSVRDAADIGWDGTHNGKDEPTGAYRYFVQWIDGNQEPRKETGVVMLIR